MTKEDIEKQLSSPEIKDIIESKDFYFQKGQDALKKWLALLVDEAQEKKLIEFSQNYGRFKTLLDDNSELKPIANLLFEITSYCDLKANKKNLYNQYEDKRVLAEANVRMGNWISGIVRFRYSRSELGAGSILNAFNYLLNPTENSTILSENHRLQVAENLFKKTYDPSAFVRDLQEYFIEYRITPVNPSNLIYILDNLIYSVEKEWKDEVIGLMASDGTGWLEERVEELEGYAASILWNTKRPSGTVKTLSFLRNIIKDGGSFPLFYGTGGYVNYMAVITDFVENQEELEKKQWNKADDVLYYKNTFAEYREENKVAKIVFLAKQLKQISPTPVSDFSFYNGFDAPRQDNLSPVKYAPASLMKMAETQLKYSIEEFEVLFTDYLNRVIPGSTAVYKSSMSTISRILSGLDLVEGSAYEIQDSQSLEQIEQFLNADSEYIRLNTNGNNRLSSAWSHYRNFVREVNSQSFSEKKNTNQMSNHNLNLILFGPPGTGKTYNSINRAVELVNKSFDLNQSRTIIKDEFDRLEKLGQIAFTTFHQSMSYEDFIEGIKPKSPDTPKDPLQYEIQAGVFKIACARAAYLCYKKQIQSKGPRETKYTFDDLYNSFINSIKPRIVKEDFPYYRTLKGKEVEIFEVNSQDSIRARAKDSTVTHVAPLTQENLEKLYNKYENPEEIKSLVQVRNVVQVTPRSTEFFAVFRAIKEFEKTFNPASLSEEDDVSIDELSDEEKVKKFSAGIYDEAMAQWGKTADPVVLIIDEINRGNISQIFGELITLIEKDKRAGQDEALEVILPYSKSRFSVPSNLYVIGTMNTADRSVEALDTALRRRFAFEEMPPKYDLAGLDYEYAGSKAFEILKTINRRIEKLLDKDHQIGHSFLIKKEGELVEDKFKEAFYKSIIPLLQEYFFGDFGKIGLVLGIGFVSLKQWDEKQDGFANFEHEGRADFAEKPIYEIIDYRQNELSYKIKGEEMDFEKAVRLLIK